MEQRKEQVMFAVRVLVDDKWSYTTSAIMEDAMKVRNNQERMDYFLCSAKKAEEYYMLICQQSKHRENFKAVAKIEASVYSTHFAERSVIEYREF